MKGVRDSGEATAVSAGEVGPPSVLVYLPFGCVQFIEKVGVNDMELVWIDADNGT